MLAEIARVLKPGGRLGVSDIVAEDRLSPEERAERGSYVGCIAGALSKGEYEAGLEAAGFEQVSVEFTHEVDDGIHGAIVKAVKTVQSRRQRPAGDPAGEERRLLLMAVETDAFTIEELQPEHWPGVVRVFEDGIATRNATFETEAPTWEAWDSSHLPEHRLVALHGGEVVGWAAVSPVSDRCCYGGVVENSVYVAESARGQGVGQRLLEELIASTEAAGIWTIEAGCSPRTTAASACTSESASRSSAGESGSASSTAFGATCSCSSGAARASTDGAANGAHPGC